MLAAKRSAGVASGVILKNPLHIGEKHRSVASTLAVKPRTEVTRCSKQAYQWPHKKDLVWGSGGVNGCGVRRALGAAKTVYSFP